MRRSLLADGIAFALLAAPGAAAQGVLPASVGNWNSPAVIEASSQNVSHVAGNAADVLKEYEVKTAEQRAYTQPGRGTAASVATVYSFRDGSGAYGAYTYFRTPDMKPAGFSDNASLSPTDALVLVGNMVLYVTGKDLDKAHAEIAALTAAVASHALWGVHPLLPQRLPAAGFVPGSDHYVLGPLALNRFSPLGKGDWLGFASGAEAEVGRYRLGGRTATLVLADYPTPQLAAAQLGKLSTQFNLNGRGKKPDKAPVLYVHRDGTLIAMLSGGPGRARAQSFLGHIRAGMIVTWNEPTYQFSEPSMPTMIVGTIIGTGEICAFTLLGGILFTVIRLFVKRAWPGRVFDRDQDMDIIQLGLSTKPIKGKDFY